VFTRAALGRGANAEAVAMEATNTAAIFMVVHVSNERKMLLLAFGSHQVEVLRVSFSSGLHNFFGRIGQFSFSQKRERVNLGFV
jgi:hypothetical protein